MTLINPPQSLFCDPGLRKGGGGVAIINDGAWVGPGTAARKTSRTSRRESIKIGTFPPGQLYYCHLFIIAIWA